MLGSQHLAGSTDTLRLRLQPFTAEEAAAVVEQVFEAAAAPPEFLSQASAAIWERSCGLPLFVEQMAVHLHQVTPSSWPFTAPSPRLTTLSPKPPLLLLLLLLSPSLQPICGCAADIDILLRLAMTLCGTKDEKY